MTTNAKIYVTVFLTLGFCVLAGAFADPRPIDATRFLAYFALAVTASFLKVSMPAIAGNLSFNFFFVLIGILDLTLPQTLMIGATSVLVESLLRQKTRPSLLQGMFGLSNIAVSVFCTDMVYRSAWLATHGASIPGKLAVAATVFFIFNTFPMSAVTSLSERMPLLRIWRERYFWSYPYYMIGAVLAFGFEIASQTIGWQMALLTLPVIHLIYRTYSLYLARLEDSRGHAEEMASLHMRTIEALALAIDAKDNTTHDHLKRVQVYAMEIGKDLGLGAYELEALRAAAVLHDIGKLAVPEYIISKPGKLTPTEFDKMKIHPVVGAEILEQVQFPYPVAPIVRAHHEKWDGTGYPFGVRGTDIPIGARILAVVDTLDALASDRQYRRALPLPEAMAIVEAESGKAFDPDVVATLKRRHVELEKMAQISGAAPVRLSTDMKIDRGEAPAAGFEVSKVRIPNGQDQSLEFIQSVATARQEMEMLFDIGQNPEYPLRFEEGLAVLGIRLQRIIPFDAIAVFLVEGDCLVPAYVAGENARLFSQLQIPIGQGLSGWVAENGMPILNGNPSVEPGYLNNPTLFSTLRSALSVPLAKADGEVLGVISLYQDARDGFSKDHLRLMQTIAPKLALSIEKFHDSPEPADPSSVDRLTGLPHARAVFLYLESELIRCKRLNTTLAVLVCTVDGLKELKDRLGRMEGDKALRTVAAAMKESCGEFDYLARLGGSEFVVVIPGIRKDAVESRILHLKLVGKVGKESLPVVVGSAFFPEDGADAEQLIGEADRRMFRSKHDRRLSVETEEHRTSLNWLQ